ncbi:hypothetical protein Pcinc_042394 [Petrolisthes cinctipes]|uniref:MPN domain-containing protein n=1 Tax=Petrolisthes cinctipes TaxID=88211 RepID=A0AAE1BKR5_PETCI|nr:hypothetical protein Pcinc_042394 [Petrolisthes cinctipes]
MSVETPAREEIHIEDEEIEDEDLEEEVEEEEEVEDEEEEIEVTHGRTTGRGLTLKTLVKEGVLQPGEGTMTINYLGNKFKGNLLPDGRIRSQETSKIFGTPSAWAIYCKKIVNPDKKSGCGWASVRYRGKKLDSYKNNWYRQKRIEFEREGEAPDDEEMTDSESDGPHEQEIVEFELIGNRHPNHDMNTMVELTSFQALGRMQPFNVTMSSSAMAMVDIHSHLTTSEVVGYLAGQWDVTNHNLIVSHALPVRCRLGDGEKGRAMEAAIYTEMEKLNLSLVGWYHTHPFSPPLPSLRDIDSQLEYELKMKGSNDASYTPCIGLIVSPYVRGGGQGASATGFWVMPPPEHKPQEYGRPMGIQFTIVQDAFMPRETLVHIRDTVKFYKDSPDSVVFSDIFQDRFTNWDKVKAAVRQCVPKDHFAPLIDYLAKLLELKNYVPEPVVTTPVKARPAPTTPKPPPTPDLIPLEPPALPSMPQTTPDSSVSINSTVPARVSSPAVSLVPEEQQPNPVSVIESLFASQLPAQPSPEVSIVEEGRALENRGLQLFKPEQSLPDVSKQPPPPPEYPQQQQQLPRGSPPPYRPPPLEILHSEPKQDSDQQEQHKEKQHPPSYQDQQYHHPFQQYQQQQLIEEYQYKRPDVDDDVKEYPREPPPSYHQQHFKIPTSYTHDPGKASSYPMEESSSQDTSQTGDTGHPPPHYPESLPPDPWPPHRAPEPPSNQSESREGDVIQTMDVDAQS